MWTLVKLLGIGAVIAMAILLPFALLMSHLLMRAPPTWIASERRFNGEDFTYFTSQSYLPAPRSIRAHANSSLLFVVVVVLVAFGLLIASREAFLWR